MWWFVVRRLVLSLVEMEAVDFYGRESVALKVSGLLYGRESTAALNVSGQLFKRESTEAM